MWEFLYLHTQNLSKVYELSNRKHKKNSTDYSIIMVIYGKKTNVHMNYLYNQPHMVNYCMQLDEIQSRY